MAAVLKQHKTSRDHFTSALKWMETKRIETFRLMTSIDFYSKQTTSMHWQCILTRIIPAVQHFSEHNLAQDFEEQMQSF